MKYEYVRLVDPSADAVNALAGEGWRMVGPPAVSPGVDRGYGGYGEKVYREIIWMERSIFTGPPKLRVA